MRLESGLVGRIEQQRTLVGSMGEWWRDWLPYAF